MRKVNLNINDIIQQIESLKGKDVSLEINRGRKKTLFVSGFIESIYPSIFTVKSAESSYSYSYADVLCGDVMLKPVNEKIAD